MNTKDRLRQNASTRPDKPRLVFKTFRISLISPLASSVCTCSESRFRNSLRASHFIFQPFVIMITVFCSVAEEFLCSTNIAASNPCQLTCSISRRRAGGYSCCSSVNKKRNAGFSVLSKKAFSCSSFSTLK